MISGLCQGLQTLYTLYLEIINGFDEEIQCFGQAIAMMEAVIAQGKTQEERVAAHYFQMNN
ncbi:MAG: hypothetical protein R3A44_11505 [Caldilineaceae bacterium]